MKSIIAGIILTLLLCFQGQSQVHQVNTVSITVSDMDQALGFYTEVLDFKKISDIELYGEPYEQLFGLFGLRMRVAQLKLGGETIELIDYLTPGGRPIAVDSRSNDLWFQHIAIVVGDMEKAFERLREHHVQYVSTAPQTIPVSNKAAAGIRAFYFRDPDQHNLELIYFPPDKGNPKWQLANDAVFLGIDHTAIAVSNTSRSLDFYRDLLGLELAGESYNIGTEQAHLNNVENASLHITSLKAPQGPGVEFLQYLEPKTGNPYPSDTRADDLWQWHTTLEVSDLAQLQQTMQDQKIAQVSTKLVGVPELQSLGYTRGLMVRDPDGHAVMLVERVKLLAE